jgi:uncharacterized membrane protein
MHTYTFLKLVHIFAVIIFMGNIITGLFWMKQADKTRDISVISFTMKGIINSDRWFTIPGVIVIVAGGIGAALHNSLPLLRTGWIFWSIILFSISGIAFGWKVAPLQRKIYRYTLSGDDFNRKVYHSYLKQWELWGLVSLLTPLAALVMMVLKIPAASGF